MTYIPSDAYYGGFTPSPPQKRVGPAPRSLPSGTATKKSAGGG